jgi:hypothetical protein
MDRASREFSAFGAFLIVPFSFELSPVRDVVVLSLCCRSISNYGNFGSSGNFGNPQLRKDCSILIGQRVVLTSVLY